MVHFVNVYLSVSPSWCVWIYLTMLKCWWLNTNGGVHMSKAIIINCPQSDWPINFSLSYLVDFVCYLILCKMHHCQFWSHISLIMLLDGQCYKSVHDTISDDDIKIYFTSKYTIKIQYLFTIVIYKSRNLNKLQSEIHVCKGIQVIISL